MQQHLHGDVTNSNLAEKKAPVTFNGRTRDEIIKAHAYGKYF